MKGKGPWTSHLGGGFLHLPSMAARFPNRLKMVEAVLCTDMAHRKSLETSSQRGGIAMNSIAGMVLAHLHQGTKIQHKVFLTEAFGNPLGSWTSAPSGHGCSRLNACSSSVSRALTEVLTRDIRANEPRMSAGHPARKLPLSLWAAFRS